MSKINEMRIDFMALPENEAFARVAVGAFMLPLNPTLEEMEDVKTAVSEAVTNAIIHGYENKGGMIRLSAELDEGGVIKMEIIDCGVGIEDVERAREPLYTSLPEMERSGMGFTVMESFMDSVTVLSRPGHGTTVRMEKKLGA